MSVTPRPKHDPMAALRQRNFTIFALSRVSSGIAMTMVQAVIAWQVFDKSDSAFQLALIGLVQFVPAILGLSLLGGAFADSHDRRTIAMLTHLVPIVTSAILFIATRADAVSLPLIYVIVFFMAVAAAFENPARQALLVSVVTPETFPNAVTVNTTAQQLGFVTGPAIGGLLISSVGISGAYAAHVLLVAGSLAALAFVRPRAREGPKRKVSFAAIKEGVHFVVTRQVLLGAMTLDMFAVIFGGATALLPIYARDVLDVGGLGYGLLASSLDIGAVAMSLALILLPPIERTGRALLLAVLGFGLGTIAFGLSRSFPLSMAAMMFVGASDQISVVMRLTTVQLATPDEMRGRVSSVNMLFIGASNQLGRVESGFVAAATTATFAVVSGGIGCLAVLGAVARWMPELRNYRISASLSHAMLPAASQERVDEEESGAAAG